MKERADKLVVQHGLAESRQKAQALIMAGLVYTSKSRVEKAGQLLESDQTLIIKETLPYVSRGGLKLEEALSVFQLSVEGRTAADLGASTGGFTDCLLQNRARLVFAVDVDTRQLDYRIRRDPRVVPITKNARYITPEDFSTTPDLVTIDLSFISVLKVLPAVKDCMPRGQVVALIKPQFEAGRGQVGKGGIIRDKMIHEEVLLRIAEEADRLGFRARQVMKPGVRGQKGNQEFFLLWEPTEKGRSRSRMAAQIKEVVWNDT